MPTHLKNSSKASGMGSNESYSDDHASRCND
jgi:hypothetical protein